MKRFLLAACVALVFTACTKNDDLDTTISPAINALIDGYGNCSCEPYADKYKWQGKYVYLFLTAGPTCLSFPLYFNEDGTQITMPASYTYTNFAADATLIKRVWACSKGRL